MKIATIEKIVGEYISMENHEDYIRWNANYWEFQYGNSSGAILDVEELEDLEAAYQEYIKEQK